MERDEVGFANLDSFASPKSNTRFDQAHRQVRSFVGRGLDKPTEEKIVKNN